MKYNYKFLSYHNNLPVNINFFNGTTSEFEWHKDIEIIIMGRGSATLDIKNSTYHLKDENIILVNSSEVHRLYNISSDSLIISLYFDPYFFEKYYRDFSKLQFNCNSILDMDLDRAKYNKLYMLSSSVAVSLLYKNDLNQIKTLKDMFHLVDHLIGNFSLPIDLDNSDLSSYHQRFNRILEYINDNYYNKITLSDLAKIEYLTTHYISRFFNKYMGVGFIKYLNNFRLEKSMYDLTNTNKSILDLCLDHGFPSLKSYRTTFAEKYNMSPSAYRKSYATLKDELTDSNELPNLKTSEFVHFLQKYQSSCSYNPQVEYISSDIDGVSFSKKHWVNFEKILYFDNAYDALSSNWQNYFIKTLEIMRVDFIKFSGVFNENMYHYDKNKNLYIWYNLETILDFFTKNHVKPFIKLEYSSKKESIRNFISRTEIFITFCIDRYGLDSVRNWKFEISSMEKDHPSMINFYTKALDMISDNNTLSKLNFGIDFTIGSTFHKEHFLKYIQDKKINFISVYVQERVFLETREFVRILLMKTKRVMKIKTYFIPEVEEHYLNDSCYKATKTIDNFINNYCMCDSQIDFIDNCSNLTTFKGSGGMLTYNGLRKPMFNAFFLLGKLKGYVVNSGDGYILTKNQDSYKLLLYNHKSIDNYFERTPDTYDQLYKDIPLKTKYLDLKISLDLGKYSLKHYTLNKKNGSIYDEWIKMGKPLISAREVIRFVKSKEIVGLKFDDKIVENEVHIKEHIILDSIKLIEITKV
ncbi:helix-turn-helix domain-containing protein [Romboutsia weinsteinii]|uniref:Helix-turn-helix domain-containing protein n=1 Tax=Romboutsia weinsteinii TaxID=2020949 RepID=A0A371J0E1_9FIRM|nr:helix-turn-helix domain-containing protein [Romboutsia weinsteinii]RDY26230.1 helix-turn-helix domain-containing protein [Romboutsia weinsteinii]